jgi:hypothetical protein
MPNWAETIYAIYSSDKEALLKVRNILEEVYSVENGWLGYIHAYLYPEYITIDNLKKNQFLTLPVPNQRGEIQTIDSEDSVYEKIIDEITYYVFNVYVQDAWYAHPTLIQALCQTNNAQVAFSCMEPSMGVYDLFDSAGIFDREFTLDYCDEDGISEWTYQGSELDEILSAFNQNQACPELFKWLLENSVIVRNWYEHDAELNTEDIAPILEAINTQYLTNGYTYELRWEDKIDELPLDVDIPVPYNNCIEKWFLEKCPDDQKPVVYKEDLTEAVRQNLKEMGYTL